jgi:trypsin
MKRRHRVVWQPLADATQSRHGAAPKLLAIALGIGSLSAGCEQAAPQQVPLRSSEPALVGGKPTRDRAYPWMVALFELYKAKPYFSCGGTLIDETHVLTAAHCSLSTRIDNQQHQFVSTPIAPEQVVVARRPKSIAALEDEDFLAVRSVVVHPLFDDFTMDYDVAVWELAAPVRLAEYPRLMTSPAVVDWLSALHLPAHIIGYGAPSEDDEASDALLQIEVPLVSRAQCRKTYGEGAPPDFPLEEIISDRMICAGSRTGGKGPCYGDSGGPLLLPAPGKTPLLAGVVSWGVTCGDAHYPDVYTNVAALADYIQDCQAGDCASRAPVRDCDFGFVDCDGDPVSNGCETLPASPATCGGDCDAPACAPGEACIIGQDFYCAPAKPVTPSAHCVVKEPDQFGEYVAWFDVLNENEGSVLIPFADQSFSDGAQSLVTIEGIPPGLIEYATVVILDRPDAGTYALLGPDGQLRSASVTADTPSCEPPSEEPSQELARHAHMPGRRVQDSAGARRHGFFPSTQLAARASQR